MSRFGTDTGLPASLERERRDVSFYAHCLEFAGATWPMVSAKSRIPMVESLTCVIPVVITPNGAAPDPDVLRAGTAPDGRLSRSENGNPIQPSTWWQVWQKVRKASLSAEELAGPLMRRPYDLRHSWVTWRLNSGVPATEVAAWAGHSVEVLICVYARCVTGLEDVWISRMDDAVQMEVGRQDAGEER